MARTTETIVTLSDDVDGTTKNIETVTFALDGVNYEIDLGPKNAKALRDSIASWTEHARKAKSTGRRRSGAPKTSSDAAQIREWAQANGIEVPTRGRIPAAIAEQYRNA